MTDTTASLDQASFPGALPRPASIGLPRIDKVRLRKFLLGGIALKVAVSALAYGAWWWMESGQHAVTDNAYVGAEVAQVNAQVGGPVLRVAAHDTQTVRRGDLLVQIDPTDAQLALARAEAEYARTLQRVSQYYAQQAAAAATVEARQADLNRTAGDLARREVLAESGAVSREQLSTASAAAEAARANLVAARQSLAAQSDLVRGFSVASHPETAAARAAVAKAKLDLARTVIRAPLDGIVAQRKAQPGQTIQPGQALMTVTPVDQAYVDANFKEGQLTQVRIGQPVKLTSDLYGEDVVYHCRVAGLGGGTGSAFAVIPAQNATGNWIKVVQRLPVRIALDPKELKAHPLRVGLSMTADIETGKVR